MTLHKLLEGATERLTEAATRIERIQDGPLDAERTKLWLEALTQYVTALGEIQTINNESVHEKLHELAGRAGLKRFP
ncbi:hypothetical protein YTPLAS18_37310 [Nitrospira sp.]|nr:hypothetical protein YTPLAS18_37310 [Nitrospira sp.]